VHSLNRSTHTQPQKKYLPRRDASATHATCWSQAYIQTYSFWNGHAGRGSTTNDDPNPDRQKYDHGTVDSRAATRPARCHAHQPHRNDMQPVRCAMTGAQPLGAQSVTTYRQSRQGLALQTRAHAHEAEEALQVCGPHARREQRALLTEADAPVSQGRRVTTAHAATTTYQKPHDEPGSLKLESAAYRANRVNAWGVAQAGTRCETQYHTHTRTRTCSHP